MATFQEFRLLLVLYYDANIVSDEDFLLLYEMFPSKNPNFPYDEYTRFDLYITHEWSWVQSRIQVWQKGPSSSFWSLADSTIDAQNLLRQFGLHWGTCCFGHFELRRKQKVSWVGRDIVGWFVRNVIMQSLEYKWQNWQYIKNPNKINLSFHRDGKFTDLTSPTWGRRRGGMRSQSRPNLTRSSRRRRPENVCILSSLMFEHKTLPAHNSFFHCMSLFARAVKFGPRSIMPRKR